MQNTAKQNYPGSVTSGLFYNARKPTRALEHHRCHKNDKKLAIHNAWRILYLLCKYM